MMAESLESRKFDRNPMLDVALPVRVKTREIPTSTEPEEKKAEGTANTMAFSLLTRFSASVTQLLHLKLTIGPTTGTGE
ncbi:Uu.00g050330.m01.CDS01 [Anthostomella pinea]|uniref:Uu.00g050330.m01.CDS01 n=1 Tax=Anthostomella pinea TaxID=933095 RepID=A0AAI8VM19_9PEZI|nr:Uu.00g050330.m01.CDS01 [Anthostomella pinea]